MKKHQEIWEYQANKVIRERSRFGTYRINQDRFYKILCDIRTRCVNSNHPSYKWYGKRGIGFLITIEDIIRLWFRDKAYLMKSPSIDRKDNNGHYTFKNCQFLERSENSRKSNKERKFNQYPVNNKLLNH